MAKIQKVLISDIISKHGAKMTKTSSHTRPTRRIQTNNCEPFDNRV